MEYKCKSIQLLKLIPTRRGYLGPLCDNCKTADCSNPIEQRKVSVMGVTRPMKVLVKGKNIFIVAACEGHTV